MFSAVESVAFRKGIIVRQIKDSVGLGLFLYCVLANAAAVTIPIAHLEESKMTDGYKKSLVSNLKGYIKVRGATLKSEVMSRLSPAEVVTEDGQQFLKVSMTSKASSDEETIDSRGYGLLSPTTYQPIKMVTSDGEVTVYRMAKGYPVVMTVGAKELISQSDTYASATTKKPIYKTNELLTLELVNGEADLYELCKTDYEYGQQSGYKKVQSESSSCFVINGQGELKGYVMLIVNANSRATYQGNVRVE